MNTVARAAVFCTQAGRRVFAGDIGYLIHNTDRPELVTICTDKVSVNVPVEALTDAVLGSGEWTSTDGRLGTALHCADGAEWLTVTIDGGRHADARLFISAPSVRSHLADVLLAVCTVEHLELLVAEMDQFRAEGGLL